MRIAIVGKGGSGKTTISAAFSAYVAKVLKVPVIAIDADINCHLPGQFGSLPPPPLSQGEATSRIKQYLRGENERIVSSGAFRKTTPPALGSNLIRFPELPEVLVPLCVQIEELLHIFAVGSYGEEDIGASCYHNSLAVLENILSHATDQDAVVVVDMVAGTDAFAGSLHAQFDLLLLVVAPTRRSVEVYTQYLELAQAAGIADRIAVIGNQVETAEDQAYIRQSASEEHLLGFFERDSYVDQMDRRDDLTMDARSLSAPNQGVLDTAYRTLSSRAKHPDTRLPYLYELHRKYVAQAFVTRQFGDLTGQIDPDFRYPC